MIYLAQKKRFLNLYFEPQECGFFSFKFGFEIGNDLKIERGEPN